MAIVTGDRYLEKLVEFVEKQAGHLIEGTLVLKLNPAGLHYVQSRLEALHELESLLAGAPVDYLRAYVSDLGDHRALEQLRRILRLLTSLKVVSILPPPGRDPTPLSFLPFGRLKVLELRGCDLSTSAAKGLLELRHTLEKIICHSSTDALRHVFASRIAEIKDSPQWNRLSFVSCACNGLVLMDESLQLLPAVETLDLSRNKFAKIDNLQKCTRLKHLDLGFNHLRTIAPFCRVSCHIVKLVLRNNALTSLRGIENLKSLEGLDVSYNIISKFSELEFLEGLPFLHSLWMEGNPFCCARWYRAQVFSFFACPEKLKLDDKEISTSDIWKRQIIIARKHKQPASFGVYIPAKDDAAEEVCTNRTRRKVSRLVLIESEEETANICSDQESVSCENEIQNREDTGLSDDEVEIGHLINRVEHMKKECSVHWLREFKEWVDIACGKFAGNSKVGQAALHPQKENYIRNNPSQELPGEVRRYASDSVLASGDDSSTNILESDSSFVEFSSGFHGQQYFHHRGSLANASSAYLTDLMGMDQERHKYSSLEGIDAFMPSRSFHSDTSTMPGGHRMAENVNISPLSNIGDLSVSHESSAFATSPPHYQEDLLHRRQYLAEEILHLSAESYSVASSDSNTSGSEVEYREFEPSMHEVNNLTNHNYLNGIVDGHINLCDLKEKNYNQSQGSPLTRESDIYSFDSSTDQTSKQCSSDFSAGADNGQNAPFGNLDADSLFKRKSRKKPKRRVISILEESSYDYSCDRESELKQELSRQMPPNVRSKLDVDITTYFNENIADSEIDENCACYLCCNCLLPRDFIYTEREVAVLLSSHKKLYILLIADATDESGTVLSLLSCHKVEEVCEVLVGVGLQVARVRFERDETYLFVTRSIEKSRELLQTLQVSDSCGPNDRCSIKSLEQVQVELFDHQICPGSNVSIYQYAMVLTHCNNDGSWLPKSLFVIRGNVLLCIEDIMQFSSSLSDVSLPPYFRIDSCYSINDIIELVMEVGETYCVTLVLERVMSEFHHPTHSNIGSVNHGNQAPGSLRLKLQWFSEDNLWKFVSLLKAIRAEKTVSPLVVRCIS